MSDELLDELNSPQTGEKYYELPRRRSIGL